MSNYNEDDDDMFDDEADLVPQSAWAAPEEDVLAIDAVLNHRLREDTRMSTETRMAVLVTEFMQVKSLLILEETTSNTT